MPPSKLKFALALLLFATLYAGPSGGLLLAKDKQPAAAPEQKAHGLTQEAVEIGRVFGLPITNSMVVTWIVALVLIIFARLATRNMKLVPDGAQNFLEWLIESLFNFLEGVIGNTLVKKTFWFFASIFIFFRRSLHPTQLIVM